MTKIKKLNKIVLDNEPMSKIIGGYEDCYHDPSFIDGHPEYWPDPTSPKPPLEQGNCIGCYEGATSGICRWDENYSITWMGGSLALAVTNSW